MIQEKLVTFAGTKGDVARKRRPSTSQSNYVTPGRVSQSTHYDSVPVPLTPSMQVSSPAPQAVQSAVSSSSDPMIISPLTSEQYNQKASALLIQLSVTFKLSIPFRRLSTPLLLLCRGLLPQSLHRALSVITHLQMCFLVHMTPICSWMNLSLLLTRQSSTH